MSDDWRKNLTNPPAEWRGKPFWAWNGYLEPGELRRQIRLMSRMGLGGFFMHSRVGLATDYLSKDWFDNVKSCINEAENLGMEAWLYDEDRWPSGAAGGLVTKDPRFRSRHILVDELDSPDGFEPSAETIAVFTAAVDGHRASGIKYFRDPGNLPQKLKPGEKLLVFRWEVAEPSEWYNGYTYLDVLNPEAVKKFIKVTHEAYAKNIGKHFGKRVPGIFTDEPNYGGIFAWTGNLPEVFKKRYGYDLLPHLVEVVYDVSENGVTPARYHYHECITFLFVDSFSRQIGEWCEKNGIQFTGHVLGEEMPSYQTAVVGDAMRFYEHMQAPGMDILTEYRREYDTAKQVSSVARQFGRTLRLTETYGCTGWDFPFAGHKAIGDWQLALGINLRCQHLSWYTMEGQAKRDYPAGIFYQSPWWRFYSKVEDYFARALMVMSRGKEVRDLLVIHPVESAWMEVNKTWHGRRPESSMDKPLVKIRDALLEEHIDFDYGCEDILARHGRVTGKGEKARLVIGEASYKAVTVPPMITIRSSTIKILKKFWDAGGVVVFAGDPPRYMDASPSEEPAGFARETVCVPPRGVALPAAVEGACRRVSITDDSGGQIPSVLYLLREDAEAYYLFVCNTGYAKKQIETSIVTKVPVRKRKAGYDSVRIRLFAAGLEGAPEEIDAETGRSYSAAAGRRKDGWEVRTELPPLASRLFVFPGKQKETTLAKRKPLKTVRRASLGRKWGYRLDESNCLALDNPRFKIGDDGKYKTAGDVLKVDFAVRDALGIPRRGGRMVQPWARKPVKKPRTVGLELCYEFEVKKIPADGEFKLALERPDLYRITLNGAPVDTDVESGWWTDRSLRKLPLDAELLKRGKNTLIFKCDYPETHPGLEIVYLLGRFGVSIDKKNRPVITGAPEHLRVGDWTKQGLPFYSGSVTYLKKISTNRKKSEHVFVETPDYRGAGVRVLVDGREAGIIGWEPNEVDITGYLPSSGKAVLQIEVLGHRRNSHGPLHMTTKWPEWTGPGQFTKEDDEWTDAYSLVPCGLLKPPRLVVKK